MEETLLSYYRNNSVDGIDEIERNITGKPTVVDSPVIEGCIINNTIMSGCASMIVDKDTVEMLLDNYDKSEMDKSKLTNMLTLINVIVQEYFYSENEEKGDRAKEYRSSLVKDKDGMIIGTKLSSLKGKNVAKCSEKSVAAYIILNTLFRKGELSRKPSLLLTKLGLKNSKQEPHACILLDKDTDNYPTKHLLFDIENPNKIINSEGKSSYIIGLYCLTDEQYKDLVMGRQCSPKHLMEEVSNNKIVGETRIYGEDSIQKDL